MRFVGRIVVAACVFLAAYGWLEAGWLRRRVVEVELPGLPPELDGIRIGHLSDLHLGAPLSLGNGASARAAAWVASRRPDVVCITGDLVSHPRGAAHLRALLELLDHPYVVLGNHDVAVTRDPFSRATELRDLRRARLLSDRAETITLRGELVSIVGVDPASYRAKSARPHEQVEMGSALRVLLCHFPGIVDRIPSGSFDLILILCGISNLQDLPRHLAHAARLLGMPREADPSRELSFSEIQRRRGAGRG